MNSPVLHGSHALQSLESAEKPSPLHTACMYVPYGHLLLHLEQFLLSNVVEPLHRCDV